MDPARDTSGRPDGGCGPHVQRSPEAGSFRFPQRLFAPVDIAVLVYFRVLFGAILFWDATHYIYHDLIPYYFVHPKFLFTYYGFGWVQPWPGAGMYVHFYVLAVLAVFILAGFCYRLAALLNFLGFTYVFLLDAGVAQNHYYLVCLLSFIMIFIPAHRRWSIDAWLHPRIRSQSAPAWALWLLRLQIAVPYVFGGITKLNADWLQGLVVKYGLEAGTHYPELGARFDHEYLIWLFTYGGLLFDLSVVPLLLWRRTRLLGTIAAVGFNLTNAYVFNIGIFPWLMLGATFVFYSPDWPRRLLRLPQAVDPRAWRPPDRLSPRQRMTLAALGIYVAYQLLMPFRHHLYPGHVNWNEQGRHFSWRMMAVFKLSSCRFYVTDPKTGSTRMFKTKDLVSPLQVDWAERDPDMILQLCHDIADRVEADGRVRPEIRVEAVSSLNGRDPQLLIDPSVDLAAQPRTFSTAPWILSLKE